MGSKFGLGKVSGDLISKEVTFKVVCKEFDRERSCCVFWGRENSMCEGLEPPERVELVGTGEEVRHMRLEMWAGAKPHRVLKV
jgi:hypothetical protein